MITVYSKVACPKCTRAKLVLDVNGVDYEVKMLDKDFTREDLIGLAPKAREFPVVFNGDELLGGVTELELFLKQR